MVQVMRIVKEKLFAEILDGCASLYSLKSNACGLIKLKKLENQKKNRREMPKS